MRYVDRIEECIVFTNVDDLDSFHPQPFRRMHSQQRDPQSMNPHTHNWDNKHEYKYEW